MAAEKDRLGVVFVVPAESEFRLTGITEVVLGRVVAAASDLVDRKGFILRLGVGVAEGFEFLGDMLLAVFPVGLGGWCWGFA